MNTLISLLLLVVVVFVTTVVQVECNETCAEQYTHIPGPTPRDGRDGAQGIPGKTGDKGFEVTLVQLDLKVIQEVL